MGFLAGVLQGFAQSKTRKELKKEEDDEKKARLKLIEIQMDREKRLAAQEARAEQEGIEKKRGANAFFQEALNRTQGIRSQSLPGTGVTLGDPASSAPKVGLSDLLSDPEMLLKGVQSGVLPAESLKQPELPNEAQMLALFQSRPDLFALAKELKGAGGTTVNVNPGNFGLPDPPKGKYRPDPTKPGLVTEPGSTTPAQEAVDTKFAAEYADYVALGGAADTQKQIAQLEGVSADLQKAIDGKGPNITGPAIGSTPDLIRRVSNPDSIRVRDNAQEVIQRNLRAILGPQFTAIEGQQLIARAFNETLKETENKARIDRLNAQMKVAARMKEDAAKYYEENGTLQGFKGKLPTLADFAPDQKEPEGIPLGSIKIGTSGGNDVWQTPDGKKLIVED